MDVLPVRLHLTSAHDYPPAIDVPEISSSHAGRSSWSRANVAGFVRIPDVTDAEAKAYLLVRSVKKLSAVLPLVNHASGLPSASSTR